MNHRELCDLGAKWLRTKGCRVILQEPFRAATMYGEQPDAIGWRDGHSILIECKTSRADFLVDSKKIFRRSPEYGMGDARLYLCPAGLVQIDELPKGWGLLEVTGGRINIKSNYPRQYVSDFWSKEKPRKMIDWRPFPFESNKRCETIMLVSKLSRTSHEP